MAATSQPYGQTPGTHADDPGDVPAERPTSLDRLDVLTGQWEMEATFEAGCFGPGLVGRGGPADRPRGIGGLLSLWPLGRCPAGRVIPSVVGVPE